MKINGNAIKVGNVIEFEGKLWVAVKTQHTQPGKGGAYMQVELKNLTEGTKTNVRFRSAETVERVILDTQPYQYLYAEGSDLIFMDQQTYDQITLSSDFVGDAADFLQDGMVVNVSSYEGKPLSIQLPDTVVLEISEADPVVKGQTASSSYKPAVLANGMKVMVPPHIGSGMKIVINTDDRSYVERAKE
jgi:elongation factor P